MPTQTVPYVVREIPLSDIIFPTDEMRSGVSFEGMDELSQSIRHVGLLNPISVRPKGDKFELIAGYRRTKACEMAGMPTVPARVFDSSDDIADLQKAHENLFREEVNVLDEGNYLKLILKKNNWKLEDLAVAMHKSQSYISRRMRLSDAPPDVQEALKDGKINITISEELAKVEDVETRRRILFLVINNGATVDVVRSWRVQYEMQKNLDGPVWNPTTGLTMGQPGNDPSKPGLASLDGGPTRELNETVESYRICHSCLAKTKEDEARLLILCPTCCSAIEPYLAGGEKKT